MTIQRAREVSNIVLIITLSYELGFRRFNSSRVQNEKIYNLAKDVAVTASHVIGDAVTKVGSTFVGETLRKSDQLHQTFEKSFIAMPHKLDDMIELPKSQPKRTYNEDFKCEIIMVKMPKCMAWLDYEPIGDLDMMEDKVDNSSPQCTPQVLPSIELYTPSVTHPEEVEETIGILMEVEPLDHMKLDDLGLNTNTHDLFISSKGFPSVDELEPQLSPNFSL
ncbi:hypothetical protein Tco_1327235 [Tanacetum coccineum]